MDKETAQQYRSSLVNVLKLTPNKAERRLLHEAYSKTSSYKAAHEAVHPPKANPELIKHLEEVESESFQLEIPQIRALDILPYEPSLEMTLPQEDILWSHSLTFR